MSGVFGGCKGYINFEIAINIECGLLDRGAMRVY
jgi:hypothetical protein